MIKLKQIMSRHFDSALPDDAVKDALRKMESFNLTMLPVCESGRVVGMITTPEVSRRVREGGLDPARARVREVMSSDVFTGYEEQDVQEVLQAMRQSEIPTLPVLDSENKLVGVFSLGGPWRRKKKAGGKEAVQPAPAGP